MRKTTFIFLMLVLFFTGCNKTINEVLESFGVNKPAEDDEWNTVKLDREIRYYNDFLGFSYAIPKGWWLYAVNEETFSESKGDITDSVSMDIYFGKYRDYSYSGIWLITFGNLENPDLDNHLGFDLDARSLEGINDMQGYIKYFEMYMLEDEDDKEYRLTDSRQITINGKLFELRDYLVTEKDYKEYYIVTLSCQVKEDYFLNIKVDYWPENTKAQNAIIESVTKAIEFY